MDHNESSPQRSYKAMQSKYSFVRRPTLPRPSLDVSCVLCWPEALVVGSFFLLRVPVASRIDASCLTPLARGWQRDRNLSSCSSVVCRAVRIPVYHQRLCGKLSDVQGGNSKPSPFHRSSYCSKIFDRCQLSRISSCWQHWDASNSFRNLE
jgi:hypothetical protein